MMEDDLKRHFGIAIRTKRSELGISQEELADRAGLHRTYISDVERGVRNLSLESIEKLAHALELSVSGLFARAGDGSGAGSETVEILLVEDEPDDIELALRAFRKARFANPVHVVHDGAEALDFLFATGAYAHRRSPLPGIILLDLKLPGMNGLECLQRLKADARTRQIPVIVLTSSRHDGDIAECRRLGVESYIVKPVDFRNFSDATPQLRFEWALMKRAPGEPQ